MTVDAVASLLGTRPCGCGQCLAVETVDVAVTAEPERRISRLAPDPAAFVVFGDGNTLAACGARLAAALRACGRSVEVHELAPAGGSLSADDDGVDRVAAALGPDPLDRVPLAVGAGTVNDLVKAAAHRRGVRYVAVATAPSMNGYTSAIAALTVRGLKSTVPATPPLAVVADPDVLAASPVRLAVSGLADLLSKPVSAADWRMAHVLWGEPWCAVPAELAGRAVEAAATVARGIRDGRRDARATLFEALILSGLSMAVAGSSSPASGGEHLISHFMDMAAGHEPDGPRSAGLHGEQVGVATAITTRAWLALASRGRPHRGGARPPGIDDARERIAALSWFPGRLRERFVEQADRKLARIGPPGDRAGRIREVWSQLRSAIEPDLALARRMREVLPSIAAPVRAEDIGVPAETVRAAWRDARWIRDRYTVLDLVDDLGAGSELEAVALGRPAGSDPASNT